jgi:hypothetical protein
MRVPELESEHFLVRAKIRLKIMRREKKIEVKEWDIGQLNKKEVKEFIMEVIANVQNTQKWKV